MKRICMFLSLVLCSLVSHAEESTPCANWPKWVQHACLRLKQVWTEGDPELYLSGYAWHNRYTYTRAKIKTFNENAWGGGLGKGFYDEEGDWHGLYAIGFSDSHKNFEPVVGYAFQKIAHVNDNLRLGAGYTVLVTARPDINNGYPFPGALPWISLNYKKFTIEGTYIPGASGAGNVFYALAKITF